MYLVLQGRRLYGQEGVPHAFPYTEIRAVAVDHGLADTPDRLEETVDIIDAIDSAEREIVAQKLKRMREEARERR